MLRNQRLSRSVSARPKAVGCIPPTIPVSVALRSSSRQESRRFTIWISMRRKIAENLSLASTSNQKMWSKSELIISTIDHCVRNIIIKSYKQSNNIRTKNLVERWYVWEYRYCRMIIWRFHACFWWGCSPCPDALPSSPPLSTQPGLISAAPSFAKGHYSFPFHPSGQMSALRSVILDH